MDRTDHLALRISLVLAPLLALGTTVLPGVVAAASGAPLDWRGQIADATSVLAPVPTLGNAGVRFDGGVVWSIPDPAGWQRALALIPGLEITLLVAIGCGLLWRLLTGIGSGNAFGGNAVRRVRGLAVLVLLYGIGVKATRVALDFVITAPARTDPTAYFTVGPGDLLPIVLGLLLLALAECFRQGAHLREDVEGLV